MSAVEAAVAQDARYRVEILVLTQSGQEEEARLRPQLPDYSPAIDFLTPPAVAEVAADAGEPEPFEAGAADETLAEEEIIPLEAVVEEDPNRLLHIEEMSGVMQDAWRRLRLSGPYRPEQYLSWEQGSNEPFPALRLHDLEVVQVDDPWAAHRATLPEPGPNPAKPGQTQTVFTDATGQAARDAIEGPQLPDPVYYYRLDGTVALRRSRFLHLDLDLQLRTAVQEPAMPAPPGPLSNEAQAVLPASFMVHELKQSRQVRSGRMEYFDGPVLGVLAYITQVSEQNSDESD